MTLTKMKRCTATDEYTENNNDNKKDDFDDDDTDDYNNDDGSNDKVWSNTKLLLIKILIPFFYNHYPL